MKKKRVWMDEERLRREKCMITREERLAALKIVQARNEWNALSFYQKLFHLRRFFTGVSQ